MDFLDGVSICHAFTIIPASSYSAMLNFSNGWHFMCNFKLTLRLL
jgi:hypothetical protein